MIITTEMIFDNNVKEIVSAIKRDYFQQIDNYIKEGRCEDMFGWMELNQNIVGHYFIQHLINYGFTNESIQK